MSAVVVATNFGTVPTAAITRIALTTILAANWISIPRLIIIGVAEAGEAEPTATTTAPMGNTIEAWIEEVRRRKKFCHSSFCFSDSFFRCLLFNYLSFCLSFYQSFYQSCYQSFYVSLFVFPFILPCFLSYSSEISPIYVFIFRRPRFRSFISPSKS